MSNMVFLESWSNAVLGEMFTRAILVILVKPGLLFSYGEEDGGECVLSPGHSAKPILELPLQS